MARLDRLEYAADVATPTLSPDQIHDLIKRARSSAFHEQGDATCLALDEILAGWPPRPKADLSFQLRRAQSYIGNARKLLAEATEEAERLARIITGGKDGPVVKGEWIFRAGDGTEVSRFESLDPLVEDDWPQSAATAHHVVTVDGTSPTLMASRPRPSRPQP